MAKYNDNGPGAPKGAKLAYGILMVCVYIGVGLLFIWNKFDIISSLLSYFIGGILCIYGVWRGVRLFKGWN